MRLFGLTGASGSGKTTLIERLLPVLRERGVRVSTLKHTHHDVPLDLPGKDSDRHRKAGAEEVLLLTGRGFVLFHEFRAPAGAEGPAAGAGEGTALLAALLARLAPVDLVLIEGFKRFPLPRLEVFRPALGKPPLWPHDPGILAVATDAEGLEIGRPVFGLGESEAIALFILAHAKPLQSPGILA